MFEAEPLSKESPLWGMPNVCVTPHHPHHSAHSFPDEVVQIFCENYRRFLAGEPLNFEVDFKKGY